MEVSFNSRVVLVTGGSRGIGRAVVELFAAGGARLVVQFRAAQQAADDTMAALPGGGHLALQADLTDPEQVRWLVERIVEEFGRIDVLVNNAGIYRRAAPSAPPGAPT
jgi:NAD(P)-dependent dehydrogenase (short-subunit alcohol dehydrogenase family)